VLEGCLLGVDEARHHSAAPAAWEAGAGFGVRTVFARTNEKGRSPSAPTPSASARATAAYFWRSLYFSMSSFWMLAGTSPYLANSIVYSALPCVAERSSVEYPNMSDSGTWASIEVVP
jgi:hypothetical protein